MYILSVLIRLFVPPIYASVLVHRVWNLAAEAEGPDPGCDSQHQRGEAAPPGRAQQP